MGLFPKPGAAEILRESRSMEAIRENPTARYDMVPDEVTPLCVEFLHEQKQLSTQYGCYIIRSDSPYSNLGRFVESSVFAETFNNSPQMMHEEYGPYEAASRFYTVINQEETMPVGVMRVIENSPVGLKSLNDLEREDTLGIDKNSILDAYSIDIDRCADLATLAVLPDYRGSKANYLPSMLTYRTLFLDILNNPDYDHVVAIIDQRAERNLQNLKFPFKRIFDSNGFSYLDSPTSYPLVAPTRAFYPQVSYWVKKYRSDLTAGDSDVKAWKASAMDALINPGLYDEMLGQPKSDT